MALCCDSCLQVLVVEVFSLVCEYYCFDRIGRPFAILNLTEQEQGCQQSHGTGISWLQGRVVIRFFLLFRLKNNFKLIENCTKSMLAIISFKISSPMKISTIVMSY